MVPLLSSGGLRHGRRLTFNLLQLILVAGVAIIIELGRMMITFKATRVLTFLQ